MFSIKRQIFELLIGNKSAQKVLAIALTLKFHADKGGMILNATYNHIYQLTGIAPKTLKRYLPTLVKNRLVKFHAGKHLSVSSLRTKHTERNLNLGNLKPGKFSYVYRQIRALVFAFCQSRKEFIKRLLLALHNPKNYEEFKRVKAIVGRLVRKGIIPGKGHEYEDFGFSYNGIARVTGTCERTAQRTVKDAVKMKLLTKKVNKTAYYIPYLNNYPLEWATYTTKHYAVIVEANTYKLKKKVYEWFQPDSPLTLSLVAKI